VGIRNICAVVAAIRYYSATPLTPLQGEPPALQLLQRGIHSYPPAFGLWNIFQLCVFVELFVTAQECDATAV